MQRAVAERYNQREKACLDSIKSVSVSEVENGCMQGEMGGRIWQGVPRDSFLNRSSGTEADPLQTSVAHLDVAVAFAVAARVALVAASAALALGSSAAAPVVA